MKTKIQNAILTVLFLVGGYAGYSVSAFLVDGIGYHILAALICAGSVAGSWEKAVKRW